MKIELKITFQFEMFHRWVNAPKEYTYLSSLHRHIAHVSCWKGVSTSREIEFIDLKNQTQLICAEHSKLPYVKSWSCEQWAKWILIQLDYDKVEVLEDGENGAVVTKLHSKEIKT